MPAFFQLASVMPMTYLVDAAGQHQRRPGRAATGRGAHGLLLVSVAAALGAWRNSLDAGRCIHHWRLTPPQPLACYFGLAELSERNSSASAGRTQHRGTAVIGSGCASNR